MLAFPYAHEDATGRRPTATLVLMALWLAGFGAMAALDSPLKAQRAALCGEATHLVVMHPRLARDAPQWPGCDLPRYVAGPADLRRRAPTEGATALRGALLRKAADAEDLRLLLSEFRFAHAGPSSSWLSPLTSLLSHRGLPALLAALLGLWLVGPTVERRLKGPALPLLFIGGGGLGVVAAGSAAGAGPILGPGAALGATLAAAVVAAPRGRVRLFWAYWWFRSGRLTAPAVPLAIGSWIAVTAWSGSAAEPVSLALIGPPLVLGALVGALARRRETPPDLFDSVAGGPSGDAGATTAPRAEIAAVVAPTPTAPELPDAPLLEQPSGAKLVTRRGRTVTGQAKRLSGEGTPTPRLMLRRGRVISLREDRAILGVGASVVEQLWDEVRWVSSGIAGDVGPVLDLITSWHETPKGPVASGFRILASETDFDSLFTLPLGAGPRERFRLLADAVCRLAPRAPRLPDDYAFARPVGYADEGGMDIVLAQDLAREGASAPASGT